MNWRLTTIELAALILAFTLSGCATTPAGKVADGAAHADHATTAIALTAVDHAAELNPLAPLGPLRYLLHRHIEDRPCEDQWLLAYSSGLAGGLAGNNLLVIAGASWHPVGLLAAVPMYFMAKRRLPVCETP